MGAVVSWLWWWCCVFFFQAEDGIRDTSVTGVQTCALPIYISPCPDWFVRMKLEIVLTFAQQEAANSLLAHLALSPVAVVRGAAGAGKTTILKTVQAMRGGGLLGAQQVMNVRQAEGPAAIEEAFFRMIEDAVESHGLVLVDDLSLVTDAARGGGRK